MQLGILIPSTGHWLEPFSRCLIDLLNVTPGKVYSRKSSLLPKNRRLLAEDALRDACTHLLYLDSDMTFPATTAQIWGKQGYPVIAANCTQKRKNIHDRPRFTSQTANLQEIQTDSQIGGMEPVFRTGTAIMMVKAEVFARLGKPWFTVGYNPQTNSELGEDYFFCQQVRAAGYEIMIDHDVSKQVGHVGYYHTTWEDAVARQQ